MSDKCNPGVIFICYVDLDNPKSGSGVRPLRMYSELKDRGLLRMSLVGEQTSPRRVTDIRNFERELSAVQDTSCLVCYIESPTYPIMRAADRRLIRRIHGMGIPVGYFYRDFYRKFPDIFQKRKNFVGRIKDFALDFLQWRTDRALENCDIVYFPSLAATGLFRYKDMRALPPAGVAAIETPKQRNNVGIYVGGVSGHYGIDILLETYDLLYSADPSYRLILVCREKEWTKLASPYRDAEWLEVHHVSGEALVPLYDKASIAFICPRQEIAYNNFAISVKLFEYMSHGLPIVATDSAAMSEIISSDNIGIPTSQDVAGFTAAIRKILGDDDTYSEYCRNVRESLCNHHLWKHRISQMIGELESKRQVSR